MLALEPSPPAVEPEDFVDRIAKEKTAVPYRNAGLLHWHRLTVETRQNLHRARPFRTRPRSFLELTLCQDNRRAAHAAMCEERAPSATETPTARLSPLASSPRKTRILPSEHFQRTAIRLPESPTDRQIDRLVLSRSPRIAIPSAVEGDKH